MLKANEQVIRDLISNKNISNYQVSKATGIPENTLSNIHTGKTKIENMKFITAAKLTDYAIQQSKPTKELTEMEQREMNEMKNIFATYEDMLEFKKAYVKELANPPEDFHYYGWESVSDDIMGMIGSMTGEMGDGVQVEIGSHWTKSGNPELIDCGNLVEVPEFDEETEDYTGNYKLSYK